MESGANANRERRDRKTIRILALLLIVQGAVLAFVLSSGSKGWGGEQRGAEGRGGTVPSGLPEPGFLLKLGEISDVPDPKKADYPDCLAVCRATLLRGDGEGESLMVLLPAFLGREWTGFSELDQESVILAHRLVPFGRASKKIRMTQRSDTIGDFQLPLYYCSSFRGIADPVAHMKSQEGKFLPQLPKAESLLGKTETIEVDLAAVEERMELEKVRITSLRQANGGDWDSWSEAARGLRRRWVEGAAEQGGALWKAGRYYFGPSVGSPYERLAIVGKELPAVQTLVALRRELARSGRHLVAVPFPSREDVVWKFALDDPEDHPPGGIASPRRQQLIKLLLDSGVDVVDVLPWLLDLREEDFPFYDCADNHGANGSIVRIASGLADILGRYGMKRSRSELSREHQSFKIPKSTLFEHFIPGATYQALTVVEGIDTLPPGREVLLVGDSYVRMPEDYGHKNANLHDHLCWEMGQQVGLAGGQGGAANIFHILRRNREDLEQASIVLFVFSPGFFTSPKQFRSYLDDSLYENGEL